MMSGNDANFSVIMNTTDIHTRIICGNMSFQLELSSFKDIIFIGIFIKVVERTTKKSKT